MLRKPVVFIIKSGEHLSLFFDLLLLCLYLYIIYSFLHSFYSVQPAAFSFSLDRIYNKQNIIFSLDAVSFLTLDNFHLMSDADIVVSFSFYTKHTQSVIDSGKREIQSEEASKRKRVREREQIKYVCILCVMKVILVLMCKRPHNHWH